MKSYAITLFLSCSVLSVEAQAQRRTAAELRYIDTLRRGSLLHAAGNHQGALQLFRSAQTAFTGLPAELLGYIAQEEIETGQYQAGIRHATECVCRGETDPTQPRIADTVQRCAAILEVVRTRLPAATGLRVADLRIVAPPDAGPDFVVRVAGQEVPRRFWNGSYPVIAGTVTIDLSAADADPVHASIRVRPGAVRILHIGTAVIPGVPPPPPDPRIENIDRPHANAEAPANTPAGAEPALPSDFGRLRVRVPENLPGLGVAVGGYDLPSIWWNRPFPVRADRFHVAAEAPGRLPRSEEVTVVSGQESEVQLQLEALPPPPPPRTPHPPSGSARVPVAALGLMGAGGVLVATSLILYGISASNRSTLDMRCLGAQSGCDPSDRYLERDGRNLVYSGNTLLLTGAAAAISGVIWWAFGASRPAPALPASPLAPSLGATPPRMLLRGSGEL